MLFFEYYTKYNSSPTEHQVFTSPPIERSIYFVHHHVLPLSVFIFQEHSSVSELMLQGSPRPLRCSRTLARPRSCSGTRQTTPCSGTSRQTTPSSDHVDHISSSFAELRPRLGDFVGRSSTCARGLPRSLSDHGSGTSSLAPRPMLGDCVARSSTYARGLCVSTTCDRQLAYSWGYSFSFRPCYKAHTSPSSKLGDYIGTMHLPVHLVSPVRRLDSQLNWEFFLDPSTTCLCHLLPGSGTKWAHFTLR